MSGWAFAGSAGSHHGMAADGSMVHDGVRYYAGPVPELVPIATSAAAEPVAVVIPAIEVTTADGTVARYVVEWVQQVPKDELPTFAVFGATQDDVLRLVTCTGEFDHGERSYTDNIVVQAVRTG